VFVTTSKPGMGYGGWLYALNQTNGSVAWGPVPLSGTYYYFPLAYDQGRLFVNNFDGTVRAFNADTGAPLWTQLTSYFSSEPVATGGRVWVHGGYGLYGLDQRDGRIVAQTGQTDGNGANPGVDKTGVYLSTGCESQYRYSLTGTLVWVDNNGCSGGGGGTAYLTPRLMLGDDGDQVLRKDTGALVGSFAGVPAFTLERVFFAFQDAVSAQDPHGVPLWTTQLTGTVTAGPLATSSAVFVGTADARIIALNPITGDIIGGARLPGPTVRAVTLLGRASGGGVEPAAHGLGPTAAASTLLDARDSVPNSDDSGSLVRILK
jgi:outer membrane protein assembly factor BamB